MSLDTRQPYSWRDRAREPALTAILAVQCLTIFLVAPAAVIGVLGAHELLELLLLAFAFLVLLISRGPVATTIATVAIAGGLSGFTLQFLAPSRTALALGHAASIIGLLLISYAVGRAVLAPGAITAHRVLGAIALYLNFGLLFASMYRLAWVVIPDALANVPQAEGSTHGYGSILYFSFVTLTSTGYGDIAPLHPFVRALANLEAVIGQLSPATLLGRLITLVETPRR